MKRPNLKQLMTNKFESKMKETLTPVVNELLIASWCVAYGRNFEDLKDNDFNEQFEQYKKDVFTQLKVNRHTERKEN